MKIRYIEKTHFDSILYDTFVDNSEQATVFHHINFLEVIESSRKDLSLYFAVLLEKKKILAVMPFFKKNKLFFTMTSLPYGCYGGFLYATENQKTVEKYFSNNRFWSLISHIISYKDRVYSLTRLKENKHSTWLIDTNKTYDEVFTSIHSKTRNQIRKADKSNVKVSSIQFTEELEKIFELYQSLVKKHSIKSGYSFDFFEALFRSSLKNENIVFKIAKLDDVIISFSVFLTHGQDAFYWINASHIDFLGWNGTNAILDNMIKYCTSCDIKALNMGAVPVGNKDLLHFKKRWNAIEYQYSSYSSFIYDKLRNING